MNAALSKKKRTGSPARGHQSAGSPRHARIRSDLTAKGLCGHTQLCSTTAMRGPKAALRGAEPRRPPILRP